MQYDIFISYKRRGSSSATAAYIYDLLTKKGYSVFFDRSGQYHCPSRDRRNQAASGPHKKEVHQEKG